MNDHFTKKMWISILMIGSMIILMPVFSSSLKNEGNQAMYKDNMAALQSNAFAYEKNYKTEGYRGIEPLDDMPSFKFYEGSVPILVSAPHAVNHTRNGEIKAHETYTGSIVEILVEELGVYGIVKTHNDGIDDNFELHTQYKDVIGQMIEDHHIVFFIDIHGMSDQHDIDIDLGTNYGFNVLNNRDLVDLVKESLTEAHIDKVMVDAKYTASANYTISHYVAHQFETPALQVEISKKYRMAGGKPEAFASLIKGLKTAIEKIEIELVD